MMSMLFTRLVKNNNITRLTAIFQDNLGKLVLQCHRSGFYWI